MPKRPKTLEEILEMVNVHSTFRHWGYHTDPEKDKQEAKQAIESLILAAIERAKPAPSLYCPEEYVGLGYDDAWEDASWGAVKEYEANLKRELFG